MMGIGSRIKELRNKKGLTQKDLADQLHVTYQAVSRWENDEAEPSIDTLKELCGILECSMDDLFGVTPAKKEEPQVVIPIVEPQEQTTTKEPQPEKRELLAYCSECNRPIYEHGDLYRVDNSHYVRTGRTRHLVKDVIVLCKSCKKRRDEQAKKEEEWKRAAQMEAASKRRVHSFIWPTIAFIVLLVIGITNMVNGDSNGLYLIVSSVFAFTFLATMILNNTFITDMWLEIASWGFVKLPGIIFEFSLDGILFLIVIKALFYVLGFLLAVFAAIFATFLAAALSIFVYPFALIRNFKGITD